MDQNQVIESAVEFAAQTGRLDLASLLLAIVAIIMALGGIYAFINFRSIAKKIADEVATEVATKKAEEIANQYLQNSLPDIISSYETFIRSHVEASIADQIQTSQESQGEQK